MWIRISESNWQRTRPTTTGRCTYDEVQVRLRAVSRISTQRYNVTLLHKLLHGYHGAVFGDVKVQRLGAVVVRNANDVLFSRDARVVQEAVGNSRHRAPTRGNQDRPDGHNEIVGVLITRSFHVGEVGAITL